MAVQSRGFRRWWMPPRKASERPENRSVTFLELFYDLVYVVLIAEIAHTLSQNISLGGIASFTFLFVIVWWAWFNGAMYHDLHANNDLRTRVFTFLQMVTVAAMAVFAHNALGAGSTGFALSFAAYQLILTFLWWRTGVHDPRPPPSVRTLCIDVFTDNDPILDLRLSTWLTALLFMGAGLANQFTSAAVHV